MSGGTAPAAPRSLYVQLLDWMMVPLVIVWPLAILFMYVAARTVADGPFDRELSSTVAALVRVIPASRPEPGELTAVLSPVTHDFLRGAGDDRLWFQVATLDDVLVLGDVELPYLEGVERRETDAAAFKDAEIAGDRVRVAYRVFTPPGWAQPIAVQVAETMQGRQRLAAEITRIAVGVLIGLLSMLVALVLYSLRRGLEPLQRLREQVIARSPDDLSPLPESDAPAEVIPLVATMNAQVERVARALEVQRRFVADAAHQMKTPLAGLKIQAELARRAEGASDLRERLAQIGSGADRAHHLVQRLLALARVDEAASGGAPGVAIDLGATAREACEALAPQALAREIDFGFEPCEGRPRVLGDATLLGELVTNLAENAIKYTPMGGRVTVRVACQPEVALEVEDTGPGIPESERARIFDRFHRVPGATAPGAGLGLSIVRTIAQRHGARVAIESGPEGVGCLFRVSGWQPEPRQAEGASFSSSR